MLFYRANGFKIDRNTASALDKTEVGRWICRKTASPPFTFKLTVGTAGLKLDHCVQVDTILIHSRPTIHMVDEATHFADCSFFVVNLWTKYETICSTCSRLSISAFCSALLSTEARRFYQQRQRIVESARHASTWITYRNNGTIGTIQRYHTPLRMAYGLI